ncbi:hypothetical protein L226DRAFT_574687 [Lentinus tigrinus ALCF2SS1-7]|uniref:HNH nuclease domain-containing protein n=1 Tax=Lentinus tigrinus ALCF2SS1-6 TaxID=1328759 RepID=A0A5C2RSL6_9APHY|nr:hypothetical protein L227DRAFT_616615 [Lentinus tigrinus ALCF2SS1-6]RPD70585.1 hypothetical protein L226DRAFT_574687 [Lentinus tigrinus ALCF2SS1-7]
MSSAAAEFSPQPLRADFTHPSPNVVSAYSICSDAEHVIDPIQDHWPPEDETVKNKLIHIRILGHLLSQRPLLSDTAISKVANDIVSCRRGSGEADLERLNKLGKFYRDHLLRPFRRLKGRTPNVSSHPSPPPFELTKEDVHQIITETPRTYSHSRRLAMHRENFRCIVTRILDLDYAKTSGTYDAAVSTLEFCHIFPELTNNVETNPGKRDYSCNVWSVLKSFGYDHTVNDLATAEKIHSPENTMMMVHDLHDFFDRLDLWFEPIQNVPNHYRLLSIWILSPHGLSDGQEITFQSADPRIPLPKPEYLGIHAACCMVAHMSGASGLFNEIERDLEEDPDPITEAPAFARALHAQLDHLSLTVI